jgi:ribosomal protein L7/L12
MDSYPEPSLQVLSCIDAHSRIQAIKLYRTQTGCTLKEAKDVIDYV